MKEGLEIFRLLGVEPSQISLKSIVLSKWGRNANISLLCGYDTMTEFLLNLEECDQITFSSFSDTIEDYEDEEMILIDFDIYYSKNIEVVLVSESTEIFFICKKITVA